MNSSADDSDGENLDENERILENNQRANLKNKGFMVIYPDSSIRAIWDISLFMMIVYQAIIMPMRIAFEFKQSDFLFYLEFVVDSMFIWDIVLNFNTGIYLAGQLVM